MVWFHPLDYYYCMHDQGAGLIIMALTCKTILFFLYSFLALDKTLHNKGYQFLLTDKLLCQNLEQYFGHQRGGTGSNNAPTMSEYVNSSRLITITQKVEAGIAKGNCTQLSKDEIIINDEPLPKRKRK